MSRILKKGETSVTRCDAVVMHPIENHPADPLWNDSDSLFETTGFLAGMDACKRRISAREIVERAKRRADEIAKEAYQKGFEQGEGAGFEIGNKKAGAVAEGFVSVLDEVRAVRQEILRQSEQNLVGLAVKLAERIVCRKISTEEGIVVDVAREVLTEISGSDRIEILLHPKDYEFLEESRDDFMERVEGITAIELKRDGAVTRGGCIINTALGRLDARIEKKMERLFQAVTEKMDERTDPQRRPAD